MRLLAPYFILQMLHDLLVSESVAHQLVEANLSSYLKSKIIDKSGPVEVLRNGLTLVKQLSTISKMRLYLFGNTKLLFFARFVRWF